MNDNTRATKLNLLCTTRQRGIQSSKVNGRHLEASKYGTNDNDTDNDGNHNEPQYVGNPGRKAHAAAYPSKKAIAFGPVHLFLRSVHKRKLGIQCVGVGDAWFSLSSRSRNCIRWVIRGGIAMIIIGFLDKSVRWHWVVAV